VPSRNVRKGTKLRSRPVALVIATALVVTACEPAVAPSPTAAPIATAAPKKVKIVSSLPLQGPDRVFAVMIMNAIRMALEDQGGRAGSTIVEYEAYDDASAARQAWDPEVEAANARRAAANPSVVAYIGTYNSGAAQVSIPILCAASVAMVSPANTYSGLTRRGNQSDEPGKYYPNCTRNFARVLPADDLQGAVGARWAKELGARRVYVLHDGDRYGEIIAETFRAEAKKIGLVEGGYEAAPRADDFRALATRVATSGADSVYYCGLAGHNPGLLLRDLKQASPSISFIGCESIAFLFFMRQAAEAALGAYMTTGYVDVRHYTGMQKAWADRYRAKYGENPEQYAIYGYEAAKVILAAIATAGQRADDRATVRDLVMGTKDFDGVLGRWSFDENGDTSLATMAGLRVTKIGSDWESSVEFQKVLN